MKIIFLCFFGLFYLSNAAERLPSSYTIDLDLPPEQRWVELMKMKKTQFQQLVSALRANAESSFGISADVMDWLGDLLAFSASETWQKDYYEECLGISKSADLRMGDVVVAQLWYEIGSLCTSIVAQDKQGNIWHGRNLDFGFTQLLRDDLIHVDFVKSGKALETVETFDEAVQYLSTAKFMAPSYLIIGGMKSGEGVVLTRNRADTADTWYIKDGYPKQNPWYVLETNFDHWEPSPSSRRETGIKAMEKEGQEKIGPAALIRVLSTKPVLNPDTLFSTVMSAAKPETMKQNTIVRDLRF